MIIAIITIVLMVGTAFLMKEAKQEKSISGYILVLVGGIITLLFEPMIIVLYTDRSTDGGVIQLVSTIFGLYSIGWSVMRMVKFKKEKTNNPTQ